MFGKLLIANRGEIAARIVRTARRMGIDTVAVYSEADRGAPHVRQADEAVAIGPSPALESYLVMERIIAAAKRTGAQAIHPGYGFLSENAAFAEACAAAGIVFVGPTPEAIRLMGLKDTAKRLMAEAGVPVTPGYEGEDQTAERFVAAATEIGYPVLVKAAAGGGGKGMRKVEQPEDLVPALESARREARSAFGEGRLLLEKYVRPARHVEVQIFGDTHGNVVHLFERDCSIQRRHQKIIEEAPAPDLPHKVRERLHRAAVDAGRAIGYVGAGTIEMLYDGAEHVYFMEMNTRLQVEHPVTELITGVDLVEWQLRVAAGERLPLMQTEITARGAAVEARVCAEDVARNYLPSTGTITRLVVPQAEHIRIDTGLAEGSEVTSYYDPMLMKVIAWGADRAQALGRLAGALEATRIAGVETNVRFLHALTRHGDLVDGAVDTGFLDRQPAALFAAAAVDARTQIIAALWVAEERHRSRAAETALTDPHSPWARLGPWRLNLPAAETVWLEEGETLLAVTVERRRGSGAIVRIGAASFEVSAEIDPSGLVRLHLDGVSLTAFVAPHGRALRIWIGADHVDVRPGNPHAGADEAATGAGSLNAPMPGVITAVLVDPGTEVAAGTALLLMEVMKMEHTVAAPRPGRVIAVRFPVGTSVKEGELLVDFEEAAS